MSKGTLSSIRKDDAEAMDWECGGNERMRIRHGEEPRRFFHDRMRTESQIEAIRATRARRMKTPEGRERRRAYYAEWRARNPGPHPRNRTMAQVIAQRERDRERPRTPGQVGRKNAYNQRWRSVHPDARTRVGQGLTQWPSRVAPPGKYSAIQNKPRAREMLLAMQGGSCAICQTEDPGRHGWVLEHNHRTGMIRGLVCQRCNWMLGFIESITDRSRIERAKEYIAQDGAGVRRRLPADFNSKEPKVYGRGAPPESNVTTANLYTDAENAIGAGGPAPGESTRVPVLPAPGPGEAGRFDIFEFQPNSSHTTRGP
ncbi:MAG: endonuclease domain-containing protein [Thermoplasmata archaeon]